MGGAGGAAADAGAAAPAGADDKLVCIYELRPGPGGRAFGSSDVPNVENWKHVTTLKGHSNNVLDVAWSPQDRWLASASVDNTVAAPPNPHLHPHPPNRRHHHHHHRRRRRRRCCRHH